jgi:DNA-binding MarR family transcriptional regulator
MTQDELHNNLNWLLLRVSMLVKQGLVRISEEYGLTVVQSITLCLLEPGKPIPMNSLSTLLGCDPSNATGIVDRLTAGSYIERKESAADRRIKTIELTAAGRELRNKVLQRIMDARPDGLAKLSSHESATLTKLLQKTMIAS